MGAITELAAAPNVDKEDVIHRAMKWQIGLLPVILVWGLTLETLHACTVITGAYDLQSFFAAILFYEGGVATLLGSTTAALFFRKTANSDGSTSETESLTRGKQPEVTQVTNIISPAN
jgi:hypothetical protein